MEYLESRRILQNIALHAQKTAEYAPSKTLAYEWPAKDWQLYQHNRWCRFYTEHITKGRRLERLNDKILGAFLSPEVVTWLENHCLNEFWFWTVIEEMAKEPDSKLPFSLLDIENAALRLFDKCRTVLGEYTTVFENERDTQGHRLSPWDIRNAFEKGTLFNNTREVQSGLENGLLLLRRYEPPNSYMSPGKMTGGYLTQVIFNPLFWDAASQKPAPLAPRLN
jgi:hypothetical protein